jgi:quinol monooxygenase YgiN
MGVVVIACYRPKPGKNAELEALMREHVPILHTEALVTDRVPNAMRAKDGTIVEVFEWASSAAIEAAHKNPAVLALWERYAAVCDYVKLTDLAESADLFAAFTPLD